MISLIQKIQSSLKWRVSTIQHETRHMEITSNPVEKTHTIYVPPPDAEWRDIEYLHELGHAYLAETVHPLFSSAYFAKGTPDTLVQILTWPKRTADDWFVDDLLMQWCPDEERAEIEEHVDMAAMIDEPDNPIWVFGAGLMFAQAIEYQVKHPPVPKSVIPIVDILRSIRPGSPSLRNLRGLTNRLVSLVTKHQLVVTNHNGIDVWKVE